jgi:peptide/nickel transport system substrate-binding protein
MGTFVLYRYLGLLALAVAACAPAMPRATDGAPQVAQPASSAPQRTLVLGIRGEPPTLASKELVGFSGALRDLQIVFNADLDGKDERGVAYPYLAEALPQLGTDSWRVLPDGRMETTYRLKPDLTWHDGAPLSSEDFVFSWQVYATPELGASGSLPIRSIQELVALDARSFVIRWKELYGDAAEVGTYATTSGLPPLPAHLLRQEFANLNPVDFPNLPFWSTEYVGLGPYRLTRWEPGTFIEGEAFAGHALGRPNIDRLKAVFIPDSNTALANLLAGEVHYVGQYVLASDHGLTLEREWGQSRGGTVLYAPTGNRRGVVQMRPELVEPAALLDLRVRRAIAHALDKATASEVLHDGKGLLNDAFISPRLPFYPEVDRVITKYPYDPRRTQQLMGEAGLSKGGDGFFVGRDGAAMEVGVWSSSGTKNEQENTVIVDGLRSAGFNAKSHIYPAAQSREAETYTKTPGVLVWGGAGELGSLENFTSEQVARPQNRWRGDNYGAWINPAYDQLFAEYSRSLQSSERVRMIGELNRILTDELPWIPYWYQPIVTAHVVAVQGPIARQTPDSPSGIHHIAQWTWK